MGEIPFFLQTDDQPDARRIRFTAPPCPVIFSSADLLNWWASTESFLVRLPLPRILTSSNTPLARPFSMRSTTVTVAPLSKALSSSLILTIGNPAGKLAVIEAPLGNPPGQGSLAAGITEAASRSRTAVPALVAAGRGLAVPGARTAADAFAVLPLVNAPVDVVEDHQTCTPRSRATSSRVRNCLKPSKVALIRLIGLVEPKHLVRMSVTPADSTTARTASPALMPVPGRAGIKQDFRGPVVAPNLVRDRAAVQRNREHPPIGDFGRLFDGHRDFEGLSVTPADLAVPVADDDEGREAETASPLHDAGTPPDLNHFFRTVVTKFGRSPALLPSRCGSRLVTARRRPAGPHPPGPERGHDTYTVPGRTRPL